jgi:hypothetical protein
MKDGTTSLLALDEKLEARADCLCAAARELPELSHGEREKMRARVLAFLRCDMGEHILTDKRVLYPRIAERLGDPLVTAPLSYDHRAIRWWVDEIERASLADTSELQRLLYGVHAVIRLHLSREEDLYAGALDSAAWPADC